jgi:hypothetical protein
MTAYINELLQETLQGKNDYNQLAGIIENYITKNNEDKYMYIIDAIQVAILRNTNRFISYEQCETLYLTIKGFESIH